jgi:hypothetical protein
MIPEYFTNNIIFLTSVDVLGRTIIHNTLDVYRTLMVGESSAAASTLYVNEKVGILTETPNVELTVNGKISSNSIIYDEIGNSTQWNSVYTNINQNSATYAEINFVQNNFLPLSGGIVTGDLIVDNTLQVGDGNPNFDFIITEDGNVGINTETPNEKLTVVGNISCTGLLYGDGSNLTGIVAGDTQATTLVRTNSGFWQDTYTTVQANSGSYVTTVTTNTPGTSAVTSIVTVSAIPVVQVPGRLYILI